MAKNTAANTKRDSRKELEKVGRSAFACIKEMVDAYQEADCNTAPLEDARRAIEEDPLSIEVRSDWASVGATLSPSEFCILLSTGGPATRIIGELDRGEPTKARLEVQDWFTPWTEYPQADEEVLLAYARVFYWGE